MTRSQTTPSPATGTALPPAKGMVWVPDGDYRGGSAGFCPEERPVHRVRVAGFWLDAHPVTNAAFRRFVTATGYVTTAERAPEAVDYPDADPALLVPGSLVFHKSAGRVSLHCLRYRPAGCQAEAVDTSTGQLGFGCIVRPEQG
jgi:formylglycine-generating enzyme required for sulfatase activity